MTLILANIQPKNYQDIAKNYIQQALRKSTAGKTRIFIILIESNGFLCFRIFRHK